MEYTLRPSRGKKRVTKEETDDTTQPGLIDTPTRLPVVTREDQAKVVRLLEKQGKLRTYRPEPLNIS